MTSQGREISKVNTSPSDVRDGDWCALKIVAIAGYDIGPTTWSDEQVAENGDKVTEEQASVFAYLMQCRRYRP